MAIGVLLCSWGIWTSGNTGYSRLLTNKVKKGQASIATGTQAIELSPSDSKAYYVRGRALLYSGQIAEAAKDFESALRLRSDDYLCWLKLGYARERLGDLQGALAAYREGRRLAPFYGQPQWYLGKVLLRIGDRDQGFAELRRAAINDPKLFGAVIDLAWSEYEGNADAVEQATQPQSSAARSLLAQSFVERGEVAKAMELFRSTREVSTKDRQMLVTGLLAAKRFPEAYEVWSARSEADNGNEGSSAINGLINGDFERDIHLDDKGFGWQPASEMQAVRISLDTLVQQRGALSLRLDWSGTSNPSDSVISQLVLVEPNTRYGLTFAVRSHELMTIGLPIVTVSDASTDNGSFFAQSKPLPQGTSNWQDYALEFTTAANTTAVHIAVRREKCQTQPCAILGRLWLDNFQLEKL
jgi:tetratricopeptide (TPR) repeat protein